MRPVLFTIPLPWIGPIPVRAYGFMVMLGCLAAMFVELRRGRKEGVDTNHIWDLSLWALIAGFIGARGYYVFYTWLFHAQVWEQFRLHPVRVFYIWEGGLAFQGGLVCAVLAVYIYLKVKRLPAAKYLDMVVAGVILGYSFARVGCFLNGCCHGRVTNVPWAVTYPARAPIDGKGTLRDSPAYAAQVEGEPRRLPDWAAELPACKDRIRNGRLIDTYPLWLAMAGKDSMPRSCPIHPTQLYAVASALLIFGILSVYYHLPRHVGQVVALFGILYAVYRFIVEFFRGDSPTPYAGLTLFQLVCVGLFITFGAFWVYSQKRMPRYVAPEGKGG